MEGKARNNNEMNVKIKESYYHCARVEDDGVTYIVDDTQEVPLYELEITKTYYNMTREEVLDYIIGDLKGTLLELEQLKEKEKRKSEKKEIER